MDEIIKRLAEIKAEAEKLRGSDEEGRIEKLRELFSEQASLKSKLEEAKMLDALSADVPEATSQPDTDADGEAEEAPEAEPEQEEVEEVEEAPEAVVEQPVALAASATSPVDTEVPEAHESKIVIVASGNVGGTNPGDALDTRAFDRIHRHASKAEPGRGDVSAIFASMQVMDGEVLSERNTAEQNSAIMASAQHGAMKPITAAAAFCGPDDIVLDICSAGQSNRPVQDLFRTVPVRGKFRYMKTATRADVSPGVNIWEEADQIALDPDVPATWKPCVDLTCRAETTVTPHAIVACSTIGTWQQLSAPEQIENWLKIQQIEYASIAEQRLLDRVRAQSRVFSAGATAHGLWTLLQGLLAHAEGLVGAVNRDTTEGYVLVVPYGFTAALAADEGMRGFSQNLAVQRIQAILRENYGIRIVEAWETDSTVAASYRTGVTNLPALGGAATPLDLSTHTPDVYPVYMLNPDSFLAGSTDVVDAGYHRDADLVRQNLVRYFWEGMEFLEKQCDHESFVFELSTCPNGSGAPVGAAIDCSLPL